MIDFHCHIDLYADPLLVAEEAIRAGIYVLSVTTTPKAWRKTAALAKGSARMRTALGLHPQLAHERHRELSLFEAILPETTYVGEIGLDGGPEFKQHAEIQMRVFRTVLKQCAAAGGRVMTIHSRHAATEVLNELRNNAEAGLPILHWFSGTKAELAKAVDQGCWFSVGPAMLRSAKGRALAAAMPPGRVLTETDGPFGTVEGRPLVPADAALAIGSLAQGWRVSPLEAECLLTDNLKRLGAARLVA